MHYLFSVLIGIALVVNLFFWGLVSALGMNDIADLARAFWGISNIFMVGLWLFCFLLSLLFRPATPPTSRWLLRPVGLSGVLIFGCALITFFILSKI